MRLGWNEDRERRKRGPSFSFDEVSDPEGELLDEPIVDPEVAKDVYREDAPVSGEVMEPTVEEEDRGKRVTEVREPEVTDTGDPVQENVAAGIKSPEEVCEEIEEYDADATLEEEDPIKWHYDRGKDLAACGRVHEAVEAYRQVLNLDPLHVKARNNLALVYDSLGLFDKACEELKTALELDTRNVEVRANLGALLGEHCRFEEAEREFKRALDLAPDDPRIRFNLGLVYFRKGLYSRAIPEFERTLALQEEHGEAIYYLAQSYNLTGQYQLSLERFEALVEFDPGNHRAFWYLGMLCDRLKDYDRARENYQMSYRLKNEDRHQGEQK
ncbi:tetratricopeptide repeat protein [Gemmatimonadota bacterium]